MFRVWAETIFGTKYGTVADYWRVDSDKIMCHVDFDDGTCGIWSWGDLHIVSNLSSKDIMGI